MDEAEIKLGELYRDTVTGFKGKAVSRHEYLHGCTRITLTALIEGDLKEFTFDAPALETYPPPSEQITSGRTGGPRSTPAARSTGR